MFDYSKLLNNRNKARYIIQDSQFHKFINSDIIDRLALINKTYDEILIIGINEQLIASLVEKNLPNHKLTMSGINENIDFPEEKFDLIIFPLCLHWINDVQGFLQKIKKTLKSDGIFICNFPGGGSLNKLRRLLISLEAENLRSHTPHISPFIQFDHVTPLLQQAGFVENIIDMEPLELEYKTPLDLMYALKNMGEGNILNNAISYSITKNMYNSLKNPIDKAFIDHINLITFLSSKTKNTVTLKSEYFQR